MQTEVLMVGRHLATSAWRDCGQPVMNAFARVYYVTTGAAEVVQAGRRIALRPGYLFLIPGFQPFRYQCPWRMEQYYLHVIVKVFGGVDAPSYLGWPSEIPVAQPADMRQRWQTLVALWRRPVPANLLRLDGQVRELLAEFMPAGDAADGSRKNPRAQAMLRLEPVLAYIETHWAQRLTLDVLARQACLQPHYLSNLFTATFGIPLRRYLIVVRIQRAQAMLLKRSAKLREIAASAGFYDEFHFSRTFKQVTGLSPSDFSAGGPRP